MASAAPVVNQGPPMVEVKNIFFKAHPAINYFADEAEADSIDNEDAFRFYNRSLECSNKHGCVLLTFNDVFYLLRVSDIQSSQNNAGGEELTFKDLKKLEIKNDALSVTPNIIALSNDENFLAVDTIRGDSAWAVIFKFSDFINQGGSCKPFCEIRCSSVSNARISAICWNPGDGVSNLVAINTDDGVLFLAKILGPNNVELNKFANSDVRCCCWSPKGKQLVVGRMNGSLSQLRLDLTEAKQIPGPEPNSIPVSILWTQTTQFLVVFRKDDFIDFMQLDVPKGAPTTYTNSGDIFISEGVPSKCSCFFVPIFQWNVVLAMTNTASDVIVLVKEKQNSTELWIPGDITDNRRAAFFLDNFARGACVYYGSGNQVSFSEVETYSPMPMLFLLSQRGSFLVYSVVNSDKQAPALNVGVSAPIPDSIFASIVPKSTPPVHSSASPHPAQGSPSASFFQVPTPQPQQVSVASFPTSLPTGATDAVQSQVIQNPPTSTVVSNFKPPLPKAPSAAMPSDSSQKSKSIFGMPQGVDARQLGTSTLPTAQDMIGLQKAVEEKRREMTTQLQKGVTLRSLEDDDQCAFVIAEVRKFEKRLADFKANVESSRINLARLVNVSFESLEKRVLLTLNVVEDFSSDMVATTRAQKEEVEVLKERILSHFSQLEYAKSLVERSRDPRYLEHLRSRPLDPASQQKFEEIKKLHNYLKNQVAECRRYFYEQNRKRDAPVDRISGPQLIYLTLSNHSKIIRRLKAELDNIKERLGLGRHDTSYEETEYLAVCEASLARSKKASPSAPNEDLDEITLNDLTAGISKVKLNRDSDRPDKKPVKLSNRKLFILKKCMPEVVVIKVKADETTWTRSPVKTASRPKPISYTAGYVESSTSQILDLKSDFDARNKSSSPTAAFTTKSEAILYTNKVPQHTQSSITSPFVTVSASSQRLDMGSSSFMNSSISDNISASNKSVSFSSSSGKSTNLFSSNLQASAAGSSTVVKPPVQVPISNITTSPSTQLPTLAGLLAAPIPNVSTSLFSSTALSPFSSSVVTSSVNQEKGLSFGAAPFSFASQQTVSESNLTNTKAIGSTISMQGGMCAPTKSPISFGMSAASSTVPAVTSSSPSSGIFGSSGAGGLSNKPSSVSIASSTPPIGSGTTLSASTTTIAKTTTSPIFGFSAALSDTLGKVDTSGVGATGSGLFSSAHFASAASGGSSVFGGGFKGFTATTASGSTTPKVISTSTSKEGSNTVTVSSVEPLTTSQKITTSPSIDASSIAAAQNPTSGTTLATTTAATATTSIFGGGTFAFGTAPSTGSTAAQSTLLKAALTAAPATTSSGSVLSVTPVSSVATTSSGGTFSAAPTSTAPVVSTTASSTAPGGGLFTTTPVSSTVGGLFSSNPASATAGGLFSSTPATTASGNLFSSTSTSTGGAGLFSTTTTTTAAIGGLFSSTVTSTASVGLFSTTPATTTAGNLFLSSPTSTSAGGLFSSTPASTSAGGLFSSTTASTASGGLFSNTPASTASAGLFTSTPASTTTTGSLFSAGTASTASSGAFSSNAPAFMSSLSISDPNKPAATTTTTATGLFATPAFGTASTSTPSIFGGTSTFGTQSTTAGQTGSSTTQTGFGVFGQSKPSGGAFGSSSAVASPVFGGSATFGGSSPFGSSFGGATASTFGSGSTGVFGSSSTSTAQSSGFGALAQQSTTTSAFGGSPFGGSTGQPQTSSIFGSPAQQKPAGGLFSSSFGNPPATSSGIFGGGGSVFGSTTAGGGAFSSGSGGVAQQGFGFSQTKPSTGTAFGSPPVFGGGATFGSTSPFGSSFASSTPASSSSFTTQGGSIFGGGGGTNIGFGALAQQGSTSPGFGSSSTGTFGASQPQQQQPSLFGSPQQQQSKPVFGGQAFSSWR